MENEKRLIDANKIQFEPYIDPLHSYPIMNKILFAGRSSYKTVKLVQEILKKSIENQPTVDAVEVVRCKDCIYNEKSSCMFSAFANPHYRPDYFCADGERREG